MSKEPSIFFKNAFIRNVCVSKENATKFKESALALIAIGGVVAIGEAAVETVFRSESDFISWFDGAGTDFEKPM